MTASAWCIELVIIISNLVLERYVTVVVSDVILETLQVTVSGTLHPNGGTVNRVHNYITFIGTTAVTTENASTK